MTDLIKNCGTCRHEPKWQFASPVYERLKVADCTKFCRPVEIIRDDSGTPPDFLSFNTNISNCPLWAERED